MRTIFHIATNEAWTKAKSVGAYTCSSLDTEGFIHFSRPHQVLKVANFIFKDTSDELLLLQVSQDHVKPEVNYEGEDDEKFPHLYGPLNLDAVIEVIPFTMKGDSFVLPEKFKLVGETLIRPGQLGDEAEIASVHTHAWLQSYKGLLSESYLASRPLSFRSRMNWWQEVAGGKSPVKVFVAESAQHGIIGFNAVEPSRDSNFTGYGEVAAIYCLNEYKKKGIGTALFNAGLSYLKQVGFSSIFLWVLKDNPTIQFYLKMNGQLSGKEEKTVQLGEPAVHIAFEWKNNIGKEIRNS